MAKAIVHAALLPLAKQTNLQQILRVNPFGSEMLQYGIPTVRGIANAESLQGVVVQPSPAQVRQGLLAGLSVEQLMAVKGHGILQDGPQVLVLFARSSLLRRQGLEGYAGFLGENLQGLRKIHPFFLHDEGKDVTAFVALSEATPGAALGENHKSRGTRVAMERTKTNVVLPRAP